MTRRDEAIERARELRRADDFKGAIRIMFGLLAENMRDEEVVVELATMLADDGQFARARRVFEHALKVARDVPHLELNYGVFLCASGRLEEGMEVLTAKRKALLKAKSAAEKAGDEEAMAEVSESFAVTEWGLARAELESGDPGMAIGRVMPYLTDPQRWGPAHTIVTDACEARGEEPERYFAKLVRNRRASPLMVWVVCEEVFENTGSALRAAKVIVEAREYLEDEALRAVYEDEQRARLRTRSIVSGLVAIADKCAEARAALHALVELLKLQVDALIKLESDGDYIVDDMLPIPYVAVEKKGKQGELFGMDEEDIPF